METGYHELQRNFVTSFAKQGGVYHTDNGVHYPHLDTDFNNKEIRRKYNFLTGIAKVQNRLISLGQRGKRKFHAKVNRLSWIVGLKG